MPWVSDSSNHERESTRQTACGVPCPSYQLLNTKEDLPPGVSKAPDCALLWA